MKQETEMARRIFISYRSEEFPQAQWLKGRLETAGFSCWMAPESIPGGSNYAMEIPKAIQECDVFVLVLSRRAQMSKWIPRELDQAINSEKRIMPFCLDQYPLRADFGFYLSNVQRYNAWQDRENAVQSMIRDISAAWSGMGSQPSGDPGVLFHIERRPKEQRSNRGIIFLMTAGVFLIMVLGFYIVRLSGREEDSAASVDSTAKMEESAVQNDELPVNQDSEEQNTVDEADDIQEDAAREDFMQEEEPALENTAAPDPEYPKGALSYGGHHYYIYYDGQTSWDDAMERCKERGGYLAVINDAEENETLYQYMIDQGFEVAFFGLCLRNGDWKYIAGDTSDYEDWGVNSKGIKQPNNDGVRDIHAMLDTQVHDGHWNDSLFGRKAWTSEGTLYRGVYAYICEWDQ